MLTTFIDEAVSFLTSSHYRVITTVLTLAIATAIILNLKKRTSQKSTGSDRTRTSTAAPVKLRNVFDVKQSPFNHSVSKERLGSSKTNEEEKPFSSSYYYAHNSTKSNGGYKDGLLAEDYVMNGPKLLSRNGVPATNNGSGEDSYNGEYKSNEEGSSKENRTPASPSPINPPTETKNNSTPINRYLWDDDGNAEGVAKIYIDSLPRDTSSSEPLQCADAGLTKTDVVAKLLGGKKDGLLVQIRRRTEEGDGEGFRRYHLHVQKMHGEVRDVKVVVKRKRLILKLYKKRKGIVWPELVCRSDAVGGENVNYVDEDLFHSLR